MQNHSTPDTLFAEVFRAVQAGEKRITWQKSHPISDSERANAKTTKWAFLAAAFALPIFSLSSCYFTPDICSPSSGLFFWLFLSITLVFNIGFIGFDIWIAKRMGRIADHPAAQPFPTLYTLQTQAARRYANGITAARGRITQLGWQKFTPDDWAEILPTASADEIHRLSQMIIQRLNSK